MSILKNSLRQKFAQIPNELITDTRISNGAFRVAAYLYSRPDNWNVNNKDVQASLGINDRGTLSKYWNELIDCGWLARELKPHDENGHFGGYDYTLLMSSTVAGKTLHGEGAPCREKPAAEKTRSGKNPTHNNKDILNNTDYLNNTEENTPPNGDFFSQSDLDDFEEQLKDKKGATKAPPSSAAAPPPNFDADISEVLTELNKLSGRSLAVEGERAKSSRAAVAKLLKKKYSKDEIIAVVQTKCFEWVNEPKMAQYLHPSTLFSSKFQTYLDQYNDLLKNPHLAEQFKNKVNATKSKSRTAFEAAQQIAAGVARLRAEGY